MALRAFPVPIMGRRLRLLPRFHVIRTGSATTLPVNIGSRVSRNVPRAASRRSLVLIISQHLSSKVQSLRHEKQRAVHPPIPARAASFTSCIQRCIAAIKTLSQVR